MKTRNKDPYTYTLADLLDDPYFIIWVTAPDIESDTYWTALQQSHQQLTKLIGQAKELIFAMQFQKQIMDPIAQQALWEQIAEKTIVKRPIRPLFSRWGRAMAAMLAFAICGAIFHFYTNRQIMIVTKHGKTRDIILPDGSEIVLNANSSIKYNSKLADGGPREVWLEGEAFFKVKHLRQNDRIAKKDLFLVHVGGINIKVLGTTFNVRDRRDRVKVALYGGRVSIETVSDRNQVLVMEPGELMGYDRRRDLIFREPGSIDASIAWKNGLLIFEDISAEELFKQLEDSYGYRAVFKNNELKKKKISGTFNIGNYDNLLKGIEIALGISIKKEESAKQLIIQ